MTESADPLACMNGGRYGETVDLFTGDAFVRLGYLAEYRGRDALHYLDPKNRMTD